MNPYTKAALFVIRLVGAGFLFVGLALLAGDLFVILAQHEPGRRAMLALECVLLIAGVVVLWNSSALAKRLTRDFEDE